MKALELGPTGMRTAAQVAELRMKQGITYTRLSELLAEAGCPIPVLGLRRIESGARRVSVDDLTALAMVLRVSVSDLIGTDASHLGADPVCKPWEKPEPGDVWLFTYKDNSTNVAVYTQRHNGLWVGAITGLPFSVHDVVAGRRIWPEVAS